MCAVRSKNERVEPEMKILKYRQLAGTAVFDPATSERINSLIAEMDKSSARSTNDARETSRSEVEQWPSSRRNIA
jgi:hypothetical protein